jgi:hypothetical protein
MGASHAASVATTPRDRALGLRSALQSPQRLLNYVHLRDMPKLATHVKRIHFEDFDGSEFERLVFAYHWRTDLWRSLEWYGQSGSDLGRDIWGVRENGAQALESVCIQCVNRMQITFTKAETDIAKVLTAPNGIPHRFRIVTQGKVSATLRDKINKHLTSLGVKECDTWSGPEFEEFLRKDAESLLKRFVEGESFPDAPEDLKKLTESTRPLNDDQMLSAFAQVFDRPAFYTPIRQESNMGDFKQAITDTIQALGTGIWKARDGHVIDRIPSRHQLKSSTLRAKLQTVEMALSRLRAKYDDMIKTGVLWRCVCGDPSCPSFNFNTYEAAHELERLRDEVLRAFRDAYPEFRPQSW